MELPRASGCLKKLGEHIKNPMVKSTSIFPIIDDDSNIFGDIPNFSDTHSDRLLFVSFLFDG
jgi:hypothetical protein